MKQNIFKTVGWLALVLCFLPGIFIFLMIQKGAVTYPFWDHWENVPFLVLYYDEGLWSAIKSAFLLPNQHCRPITLRLLLLFNGILTKWDIRSEYIYLYLTLFGTFAIHYLILKNLDQKSLNPSSNSKEKSCGLSLFAIFTLSVISLLYFSPSNHNNHWWSWMIQLNLYNFLSLSALALICFEPRSFRANTIAAVCCWLSVYTLTNGLFLVLVIAVLSQLGSLNPFRLSKWTFFWIINIALIYWTYFPIPEPGMTAHPSILSVIHFFFIYLGTPLTSLMHFPYENIFEPPVHHEPAFIFGILLFVFYGVLLWRSRKNIFNQPTLSLMILIGFGGLAMISAFVTGWARVTFDEYGVRNGASSRYVMTGSYLTFGILYFFFQQIKSKFELQIKADKAWSRALVTGLCFYLVFVFMAVKTYRHSTFIYSLAASHNNTISYGYNNPAGYPTIVDKFLYPDQERLQKMRKDLIRLKLGPYAHPQ